MQPVTVPEFFSAMPAVTIMRPAPVEERKAQFAKIAPQERSTRSIGSLLASHEANDDFNTTTHGGIGFRQVEPVQYAPLSSDARLQKHLEELCEALRSRY